MKKDKFISFDGTNQTFADTDDKKLSIYTVFVPITEGQTQCNRLKQICIDNGLPIWRLRLTITANVYSFARLQGLKTDY